MKTAILLATLALGGCEAYTNAADFSGSASAASREVSEVVAPDAGGLPTKPALPTKTAAGVALPTKYSVAIDPGMAADDTNAAMAAIFNWEQATPARFEVVIAPCASQDICLSSGTPNYNATPIVYNAGPNAGQPTGDFEVNYTGPLGECDWTHFGFGGHIQMHTTSAISGAAIYTNVVEHELGHAMGLSHHGGANVMSSAVTQSVPLSADDVAQWQEVRVSGPQTGSQGQ